MSDVATDNRSPGDDAAAVADRLAFGLPVWFVERGWSTENDSETIRVRMAFGGGTVTVVRVICAGVGDARAREIAAAALAILRRDAHAREIVAAALAVSRRDDGDGGDEPD